MTAERFKRRYPAMHARTRFGEVLGTSWASRTKEEEERREGAFTVV